MEVELLPDVALVPLLVASWAALSVEAFGVTVVTLGTVMIYLSLSNDIDAAGMMRPRPRNRVYSPGRNRPRHRERKRRASLLLLRIAIALSELAACKQPSARLAAGGLATA